MTTKINHIVNINFNNLFVFMNNFLYSVNNNNRKLWEGYNVALQGAVESYIFSHNFAKR